MGLNEILRGIACFGGAIVLSWWSTCDTSVAMARNGEESVIQSYNANFPRNAVWRNEAYFSDPEQLAKAAASIRTSALRSLADDPVDAMAIRQLAIVGALKIGESQADLLELAERVSRRDLVTQLTLIEVAVDKDDTSEVLHHYDRALTVYPQVSSALYPTLARATDDPDVRTQLGRFSRSVWFSQFLSLAIDSGANPADVVGIWNAVAPSLAQKERSSLRQALLGQLAAKGDYVLATQVLGPESLGLVQGEKALVFSPENSSQQVAPFSWRFGSDEAVSATPDGDGSLEVEISPARSGLIAERVTLFGAGIHALQIRADFGSPGAPMSGAQNDAAIITMQAWCLPLTNVSKLLDVNLLPNESLKAFNLTVPPNCVAQQWRISGTADLAKSGVNARLRWLGTRR